MSELKTTQLEDDLQLIEDLQNEVQAFYARLFLLGTGGRFHAFVEWCGVMSEHLNITRDLLQQGVPAFNINRHTGNTPEVASFRLSYLGEKIECIFDGLIEVKSNEGAKDTQQSETTSFVLKRDLGQIPQWNQTQRATEDQLRDLAAIGDRVGLYDAADHLRRNLTP